ncbi:hypothetical protein ACNOYE_15980 [Nannocystaceae bacterium ST9]
MALHKLPIHAITTSTITRASLGAMLIGSLGSTGCLFGGYDGVFIESEDVSIDVPEFSEAFRAEGDVRGDAWWLINQTAADVNGWVGAVVETTGYVVEFLNNHRETSRDGQWRVYGPFDDNDGDVAWMVKIEGSDLDTTFEFYVAEGGSTDTSEFVLLTEGDLNVQGDLRTGSMHIDFDTYEAFPALDTTALWSYAGDLTIEFERDVASGEKTIGIQFDEFVAERTGYLEDDTFSSDETYEYHKAGDGAGSFHLALMGEWDTYPYTWSGPEQERMQLDMVWKSDSSGRARAGVTEVDGVGDMKYGDAQLDECFNTQGYLTWRGLTEAYAAEVPGYAFGDEATCVVPADGL